MNSEHSTLNSAWWALRIGLGVGPLLAGLDKFFNLLADWNMYLSPSVERMLPMSGQTFMHIVGIIEMIAGLVVLSRWTRLGAYVVMLWLIAIAANLALTGMFFDLAVRDVEIAIGAFALARLTEARQRAASYADKSSRQMDGVGQPARA
ncbi:MAG TPA: DoxX family membrane protein [Blastocatellia bacterium]|nr:DoxX family membrane protein [Blastocatellia bacterium]